MSHTLRALEKFLADTRTDGSVEVLRTDGGSLFLDEFEALSNNHYIKLELTPPNSPRFIGFAERGVAILRVMSLADLCQAKNMYFGCEGKPDSTDSLWAQSMNWTCSSLKTTATT